MLSCANGLMCAGNVFPMQDDRITRYRQAAVAARQRARTAIESKLWNQIADAWEQLASEVELLSPPAQQQGRTERLLGEDDNGLKGRGGQPT
jgi:hypothetical protein